MVIQRHVIVGGGIAALSAMKAIKEVSPEDEVKLVTKEDCLPHCVANLPYLISGRLNECDFWLVEQDRLDSLGGSLVRGKEVRGIRPDEKKIFFEGGEDEYDKLLVATGSHPVTRQIKGLPEAGFIIFHTFRDYEILKTHLKEDANVVIFGGGLVAVEVAMALLEAGYHAELVVRSRILRRYFSSDFGDMLESILINRGAKIHKGVVVDEVRKENGGSDVLLSDGRTLHSDVPIVLALGVEPVTGCFKGSGVKIEKGVVVNNRMMTNVADIYAAGDMVASPNFFTGESGINAILADAVDQGRIAGRNMAGQMAEYEGWIPMNVLHLFDHKAVSVGLQGGENNEVLEEIDQKNSVCKRLIFEGNRQVGASFVDVNIFPWVFRYLVREKVDVGSKRDLLFQNPKEMSLELLRESRA